MALNTNYFPGDNETVILAKLLLLFGGSPTAGDGRPQILRKLLAEASSASGGLEVPLNFQDSADDVNAVIYNTGGTDESARFTNDRWLQFNCDAGDAIRVQLSNQTSQIAFLGAQDKTHGAFFEVIGQDNTTSPGCILFTTKNQNDLDEGSFRVLNAPADSTSSTTRFEISWNGDTRVAPVWNDNLYQFEGFRVDVTNTNSADDSKTLLIEVNDATVFSVNKHGNVVQKQSTLTYAASVEVSFTDAATRKIALTGDLEITTDDRSAGRAVTVHLTCDGSGRNFTWSEGWKWVGSAAPASIAAGKIAILTLTCFGPGETDIVAVYAEEP